MGKDFRIFTLEISRSEMGVPMKSELMGNFQFFGDFEVETGDIYFLPLTIREELEEFDEKIKKSLEDKSIVFHQEGNSSAYTTSLLYEMFMDEYKEFKSEYEQLRDKIAVEYDELKRKFLLKTKNTFSEVKNINDIINEIKQSYPSKEEFINSFNISVVAFPLCKATPSPENGKQLLGKALERAFNIAKLWSEYDEKKHNREEDVLALIKESMIVIEEMNITDIKEINDMLFGITHFENLVKNGYSMTTSAEIYIRSIKQNSVNLAVKNDVLEMIGL